MKHSSEHRKGTGGLPFGLRVAMVHEHGYWFAQGLDVDYFAEGETREEAKRNFEEGLATAVKLYVHKFGTWRHLKPAPPEVAEEYTGAKFPRVTVQELPKLKDLAPDFPYLTVRYFEPES